MLARRLLNARRMRLALGVVFVGLVSGCVGGEDAPDPVALPLGSVPGFSLGIQTTGTAVYVPLTTANEYTLPCPRLLDSFEATIDGTPMRVERGFVSDIGLDSPEYVCELPYLYSTAGGRQLRIADATATFDIDLGDAATYRTAQLSSTTLVRGEPFTIAWSAAGDLEYAKRVEVYLGSRLLESKIVDGKIEATLPTADEQPAGYGAISVHVESERPCAYASCAITTKSDELLSSTLE